MKCVNFRRTNELDKKLMLLLGLDFVSRFMLDMWVMKSVLVLVQKAVLEVLFMFGGKEGWLM